MDGNQEAESSGQAQARALKRYMDNEASRNKRRLKELGLVREESKPPKDESVEPWERNRRPRLRKRAYRFSLHRQPPPPLDAKVGDTVSMYIVGGQGPHREGQPGFAVVNREGPPSSVVRLELTGDLTEMTAAWTVEELTAGRRLVKLYRRQTGTRIEMHFHQLPANQYDPTAVAISCIWNQNLEDYVVTYADILHALESLLMTTLAKEELIRVARLMEHFEPDSHAASKALFPPSTRQRDRSHDMDDRDQEGDDDDSEDDQEDFFAVLRAYENPRPRKEEREIRFYEWGTLETILQYLLSKYKVYTFDFRPKYPNVPSYNRAVLAELPPELVPVPDANHRTRVEPLYPLRLHTGSFPVAPLPPSSLIQHPPPHWPEGRETAPEPYFWADNYTGLPKPKHPEGWVDGRRNRPKNQKTRWDKGMKRAPYARRKNKPPTPPPGPHIPQVPKCRPSKRKARLSTPEHPVPIRPPSYPPPPPPRQREKRKRSSRSRGPTALQLAKRARKEARLAKRQAKIEDKIRRRFKREMRRKGLDIEGNPLPKRKRYFKSKAKKWEPGEVKPKRKSLIGTGEYQVPNYGTWREVEDAKRDIWEAMGLVWPAEGSGSVPPKFVPPQTARLSGGRR